MQLSNQQIAKLLREIAAAYTIKKTGNIFEIRAYENAADSIEHLTSDLQDFWEDGKLGEVSGLGKSLQGYLDKLFRTGAVAHFESVKRGIPQVFFELIGIPGVGPKTARELAKLGTKSLDDLKKKIKSGDLIKKGFSGKIAQKILQGIEELGGMADRMLLPYASVQAGRVLQYLKQSKDIIDVHPLGSLRRQVATIGDLDFSASSKNPKQVIDYFCKLPGVSQVVEKGETSATVILQSGLHVDLLVGQPESYGALLQHFTGSKSHNIKLRELANQKGYSLSEYGVKRAEVRSGKMEDGKLIKTETEEEFYKLLGMQTPPPELREDSGEIEAALVHKLPDLVELKDIRGDLHLHSNFPFTSYSHAPGVDSIGDIAKKAIFLGYEFVGISDHPPGQSLGKERIINQIKKRTKFIQSLKMSTKNTRVLNGLEIDILPDGSLSVPDEALESLDYCIAGIHSGHRGSKEEITGRLLAALNDPYVDIISHPTNRLLNERRSSEADWEEIFKVAAKNKKILEINGYPNRLDLRDDLVRKALEYGVKFVINTDAHALDQMDNMKFGVSVARRGWAEKEDIVNTWDWTDFVKWFKLD